MRVYVAGALSTSITDGNRSDSKVVTDYIQNVHDMCMVAARLTKKGYAPYVPGLDFLLGVVMGDFCEGDYRGIGMAFLEVCEAVLAISDSYGVREEVKRAEDLMIPVFYNEKELDEFREA